MNKKTTGALALMALCLLDGKSGSRVIWSLIREHQHKKDQMDKLLGYDTMKVALYRLQKDGLVAKGGLRLWKITKEGRDRARMMGTDIPTPSAAKRAERNTIVMFDVPEKEEKKRRYLRAELVALGFELLQKSVWIGGGPLPKEFIEYLRQMRLLRHVHIFSINKKGTILNATALAKF